jgi:glycosyltransferase involved in cell wall biosynthesis
MHFRSTRIHGRIFAVTSAHNLDAATTFRASRLLLDVGVPFRVRAGELFLESQAHHGVQRWLDNFESITLCAPVVPDAMVDPTIQWVPAERLMRDGRLAVAPLPWGYDVRGHMRHVSAVRRKLRDLIPQHTHLCFANIGWLGAWGRIGAEEAYAKRRRFAVWLDWVLQDMPLRQERNALKRAWRRAERAVLGRLVLRDIRRASLGLFNGKTVFDAYAHVSRNPQIVHDIHLTEADIIPERQLEERLTSSQGPLRIIYVGRVHEMKGPRHWLDAIATAIDEYRGGRKITATWIGDGPLLEEMRTAVAARNLSEHVSFPGLERDRARLVARLREADLFSFCHLTPESPRCLIEALMSGLPIVGFSSAYALGLLGRHLEGGLFVPVGDSTALGRELASCLADPARLWRASQVAYAAGREFSDVRVFRHRSDLIKEYV